MEVKVLRPFWYEGAVKTVDTTLDLPDALAREVVFGGKAERVIPKPAPPKTQPEPEPPVIQKQPMTSKSAPALAGKKGD